MHDSQGNHMYDMILGHYILPKLNRDLCLYEHNIRGNISAHIECMTTIKYVEKPNFNASPYYLDEERFRDE